MTAPGIRYPSRGEIWWINMPADPPDKGKRPVIIVSLDGRNHHPRANSVLVVPLSTSILRMAPSHLLLRSGETGLNADSAAQADNICTVSRALLAASNSGPPRTISNTKICQLAKLVQLGMGCAP